MSLAEYHRKRRFAKTPEPKGKAGRTKRSHRSFVIQKHAASSLHYDFRLEWKGVLLSWAVPKGPSLDPAQKRLAVKVEDHPLDYASFEGMIPAGEYGGGSVIVWDRGTWEPEGDPDDMLSAGRLKFRLDGEKLSGVWNLVRTRDDKTWLLIKSKDDEAVPLAKGDILSERPESVTSGRTVEEVGKAPTRVWKNGKAKALKAPPKKSVKRATRLKKASGAVKTKLPASLKPQLATRAATVPAGDAWIHEVKYDGYRLLCRLEGGEAHLFTRDGHDWTHRFPEIATAANELPVDEAWLDGEAVAVGEDGHPAGFSALQRALSEKATQHIVYCVFDLPFLEGQDLRNVPLIERKSTLQKVLTGADTRRVQFVEHLTSGGEEFFRECVKAGLEGIISKRADSKYRSERSASWLKIKGHETGEFVVGGFSEPKGARTGIGALLLGEHDSDGGLRYVGRVGTGFDAKTLSALRGRLERLERKTSPFIEKPGNARSDVHWVRPEVVIQVASAERTADGILRHARFEGLREDKSSSEVTSEGTAARKRDMAATKSSMRATKRATKKESGRPRGASSRRSSASQPLSKAAIAQIESVKVTNPDRVLYPSAGITKAELIAYYASVAEWILPHVAGRPLSLVRCPEGVAGECFFQRHAGAATPTGVERVPITGEEKDHLVVHDLAGLASLVQMGVLEIHVWGAKADKPDRPDRMIFDLDPGEGVAFAEVVETALLVRDRLQALGLESWVKTTGGKGLHVVVPLDRRHAWKDVKDFAKRFASRLSSDFPKRYLAKASKAARRGRIYVDYLRNDQTATAVAAYSTRARDDAPVSVPLAWDELTTKLDAQIFTIRTVPERLADLETDPWEDMASARQSITAAARRELSKATA